MFERTILATGLTSSGHHKIQVEVERYHRRQARRGGWLTHTGMAVVGGIGFGVVLAAQVAANATPVVGLWLR